MYLLYRKHKRVKHCILLLCDILCCAFIYEIIPPVNQQCLRRGFEENRVIYEGKAALNMNAQAKVILQLKSGIIKALVSQ